MTDKYTTNFRVCIFAVLLFFTALTYGQSNATFNERGERQGVVRIKVTKTVGNTLKANSLKTKRGVITTGVSSIDAVSSQFQATNITRLFPENPNQRLEAKLRKHGLDLWYEVTVNANEDAISIAKKYQGLGEVTIAETQLQKVISNYQAIEVLGSMATFASEPFNDPYLPDQWHYNNTGQTGYPDGKDVNLYAAWKVTAGSSDVIVSIHDEGIDVEHEDLADNMWTNDAELNGEPGVDDDGNGYVDDIYGWNYATGTGEIDPETHGTHVAGTVAAVNNNGIGVSGVAGGTGNNDGAKLMSLKVIGGSENAANSYVYAADNGAVISQNSWGYNSTGNSEESVRDAINYFIAEAGDYVGSPMKGGIVIFASGNSNSDGEWYPGYYPEVLTVSSIGPEGIKATYSNYGTWVDISAPGGDSGVYGTNNGVLSTLPNDKIGYLNGTSMACPHVSGISALALANSPVQITPEILLNKLLTGTTNIDELNPDYIGKLGELSDAYLAIQNDEGIAPLAISDLTVDGMAQEFANLSWSVPTDKDDTTPVSYAVYYSQNEITTENFNTADKIEIKNTANAGDTFTFNVEDLYGLTTYYFAVTALDRWGNISSLSNITIGTTNAGPAINVDEASKDININVDAITSVTETHDLNILNEADGILRWEFVARHKATSLSYNRAVTTNYPTSNTKTTASAKIIMQDLPGTGSIANAIASPMSFESNTLEYYWYMSNIIGDEDVSVPNSSATKFTVNTEEGFNLTNVKGYLKHDPALGEVIVEIYKNQLTKENLMYTQNYSSWGTTEHFAYIALDEQLFFENGESFFVVFHVPAGNLYPLGIGPKLDATDNSDQNCFMSFDMGSSWASLPELLESEDYVWGISASTYNEYLGVYLTLDPVSGEIAGNDQTLTTLTANAETLINGTYNANVILESNDGTNPELRLPVTLTVENQQPILSAISELNFGNVFQGKSKELTFTVSNIGYGNFSDITVTSSNPQFEIVGYAPWKISAQDAVDVTILYTPGETIGNDNGILAITSSSNEETADIILFGVNTAPAEITITPETQTVDNITIGDQISANITVENTGATTLKYFIPGYDTKGISDNWEDGYNASGYKFRSNQKGDTEPIEYAYQDISASGTQITQFFKENDNSYLEVDMGFNFPYFKRDFNQLYVAKSGFTTFSDEVSPINFPKINGAPYTPKGYISVLGTYMDLSLGGNIYYEVQPDRVIVQYENVTDGYNGNLSAQMVLHSNGDIRFYYSNITYSESNTKYLNILIEDYDQVEGILYNDYTDTKPVYSGMAIGYDYPGPDIITSISNGSGILLPGDSAELEIKMDGSLLNEGLVNRYISFISNDPKNSQKIALIKLNVTDGGTTDVSISTTALDFGTVFQGAIASKSFFLSNDGTAISTLTSFEQSTDSFVITGEKDGEIAAGSSLIFDIELPTDVIGDFEDLVTITNDEGTMFEVILKGSVTAPPAIVVDLTAIEETLNFGETASHKLTIENTGKADLEIVATGTEWLSLGDQIVVSDDIPNFTYTVETYNTGENYDWLDISEMGTQIPLITDDVTDPEQYYRETLLENPIRFYGEEYDVIYIAENGAIMLEKPDSVLFSSDDIPSELYNKIIAPYWTFGGTNSYLFPDDSGIFLYTDENKTVISWDYLTNNFGAMGDPISAQVIFYNNGTMKFQYKVIGGLDLTSQFSTVGIQNSTDTDHLDYVLISNKINLNHGAGLAYVLTPAEKQIIEAGQTLTTYINIDAGSVYAGTYASALKLRTNVPNKEALEKPVTLTVVGEPAIDSSIAVIEFGDVMAYKIDDAQKTYLREFDVLNTGVSTLQLSGMAMESNPEEYMIEMFVYDSWFGFYYWSNIDYLWEWPSLAPNGVAKFRITYAPETIGEISNNVIVTSALDPLVIPVTANVTAPPVFAVDTEAVYSSIATTSGTDSQTATFNNTNGEGELTFELSLDYLRAPLTTSAVTETMGSYATHKNMALHTVKGTSTESLSIQTSSDFNSVLAYDEKEAPDTYIGYGGTADFNAGTKFNAGPNGFSLSHVQTAIRATELLEGDIQYEIRAGGISIADATILGSGSVTYDLTNGLEEQIITFELMDTYEIYPNENFYIILTYPFELTYPQGVATGVETAVGRFTTFAENEWLDLQEIYNGNGWMVRAMEETYSSSAWVVLQDLDGKTVEVGATQNVSLDFFAELAERGNQYAKLVIQTNDPLNTLAQIPVTLHVNKAPSISDKPELIIATEGKTSTSELTIVDDENNDITVVLKDAPVWLTHSLENNVLTLTMSPDYDSEGVYNVEAIFTDSNEASHSEMLTIEVMDTNRAPEAIVTEDIYFEDIDAYYNESFSQFFMDPDGDAMTFEATIADPSLAALYISGDTFVFQTIAEGTTTLHLVATDDFGNVTKNDITIHVGQTLSINDNNVLGLHVFPNPASDVLNITASVKIDTIELYNLNGQLILKSDVEAVNTTAIDVSKLASGVYFVKATSNDKSSNFKFVKN
ncbi:S8 family serine peptidase [Formosa sp. PL04]|uniref:S8 family serine peptidase n=1 Tax=Formosa sp. PL04 TaxID=3081755 RepID=UPI0029819AAC|nr:S8 family serine peptidase [Formosa sp. PL04]MDW5289760.1 S8 family serine peptidase [Formosa sp. PL04]